MPLATISVRTVQKGITYWLAEEFPNSERFTGDAAHPGRIDGRWGPMTHEALRDYVVFNRPGHLDAARVLAPLRSTPARATQIELESFFVGRLNTHALLYRPPRRGTGTEPRTPAPSGTGERDILLTRTRNPSSTRNSSSTGSILGGLAIAGAVALLGAAVVSRGRAAKRRREAQEEDELFDDDEGFLDDDELVPA